MKLFKHPRETIPEYMYTLSALPNKKKRKYEEYVYSEQYVIKFQYQDTETSHYKKGQAYIFNLLEKDQHDDVSNAFINYTKKKLKNLTILNTIYI